MGADSNIGVGALLVEEQPMPHACETTELVVLIDLRRRNDRSRQAGCVPTTQHDKSRIRTAGRDAEIAKADREVLVTATSLR